MKINLYIKRFLIFLLMLFGISYISQIQASFDISGTTKIQGESMVLNPGSDPIAEIGNIGISIFDSIRLILGGLLLIFIVYVGIQMIRSMGSDEDKLSKLKRQLWYSIVALLFINIPGALYDVFKKGSYGNINSGLNNTAFKGGKEDNLFFDWFEFGYTFGDQIVGFIQVFIFAVAVFILVLQSIKLISSMGKDEIITETKNKIVYSALALIFVGVIEVWKSFTFTLELRRATNIFTELANFVLFFAGPIAFFFLSLAGYYLITSAGDEEKIKKAKSIVINTLLGILILLAAYAFLIELGRL